jgi:hypothetical protein
MWKQSENIVHRLFSRQINRAPPDTHVNTHTHALSLSFLSPSFFPSHNKTPHVPRQRVSFQLLQNLTSPMTHDPFSCSHIPLCLLGDFYTSLKDFSFNHRLVTMLLNVFLTHGSALHLDSINGSFEDVMYDFQLIHIRIVNV